MELDSRSNSAGYPAAQVELVSGDVHGAHDAPGVEQRSDEGHVVQMFTGSVRVVAHHDVAGAEAFEPHLLQNNPHCVGDRPAVDGVGKAGEGMDQC